MKSATKKVAREALLVLLLFSVWGTFEFLTGYSEHARWYGLLSVAITSGVAVFTVPRWVITLTSERSMGPQKKQAKWKFIAVGALVAGFVGGGLAYLLEGLLGAPHFSVLVFSTFWGLGLGFAIFAKGGVW